MRNYPPARIPDSALVFTKDKKIKFKCQSVYGLIANIMDEL